MDTAAKFLVDDLLSQNINTYFGIPGGPIVPMFDAVLRTPKARLIQSKHETAALFEAIGYYKVTGKIPVVLVSAGPGITNSLTGLHSARALNIPLFLICGDVDWRTNNYILLQNGGPEGINIKDTFAPHVERVILLNNSDTVSREVISAISNRQTNKPFLGILPINVSNHLIDKPKFFIGKKSKSFDFSFDFADDLYKLLDNANKPLLVLGNGATHFNYRIESLVNHLGIPFVTTPQAKGLVSEKHSLSLRNCGLAASKWIKDYLVEKPDLVIVVGSDLDDCSIGSTEFIGENTYLYHVDINSSVFDRRYKTSFPVLLDIKDFCDGVLQKPFRQFRTDLISDIKANSPFNISNFAEDDNIPVAPHRVTADLEKAAPGTRIVSDIGEHMLFCLHYLTSHNNFNIDMGLGSMGSGICTSIGMCLADKKPTICICGDGGFQMHGMEILTAIKNNLPIIFAIFNDARYNMVYHGFKNFFNREEHLGETDYIDFVKLAESLGISGYLIDRPGQIDSLLLDNIFNQNRPAILDIRIDRNICMVGAGRNEALKHMGGS